MKELRLCGRTKRMRRATCNFAQFVPTSSSLWKLVPDQTKQTHLSSPRCWMRELLHDPASLSKCLFRYVCPPLHPPQLRLTRYTSCGHYRGQTYCTRTCSRVVKCVAPAWNRASLPVFNSKKLLRTRAPDNEIIMRPFSRTSVMHSLPMRMQPTRVRHVAAVRTRTIQLCVLFDQCIV